MTEFWNSSFWRDLNEGAINFRDNLQFELKSEFPINTVWQKNVFRQEIYMFIPDTLQINRQTYLTDFFYMDQTNLIRYQTPVLTLAELIDDQYQRSPFYHLKTLLAKPLNAKVKAEIVDEMQLFASIFRSALRKQMRRMVLDLQHHHFPQSIDDADLLLAEIVHVMEFFKEFKATFKNKIRDEQLCEHLSHIDEYFIDTIEYYLTGYFDRIKIFLPEDKTLQNKIGSLLIAVGDYRRVNRLEPTSSEEPEIYHESILHRLGLLNKFVKEALRLKTDRLALQERYGQAIGSLAAGIAMSVYMTLFAIALLTWVNPPFVFTSFPIILIAVVLYILKDRLKESLKVIYKHQAFRWFPDFTTKIETPKGEPLGEIKEYFSFIDEKIVPPNILAIRSSDFHEELPALKRHESIMEYKRDVQLYHHPNKADTRLSDLVTIFRFNVHRFIQKANDSLQTYLSLDKKNLTLVHEYLPKVYHLNIIIRSTYQNKEEEIDKFRVVVDKTGIKRVEKI